MAGGGWWVESPKRGCSYSLNGSFQRQFAPLCRLRRHLPHTGGDHRDLGARERIVTLVQGRQNTDSQKYLVAPPSFAQAIRLAERPAPCRSPSLWGRCPAGQRGVSPATNPKRHNQPRPPDSPPTTPRPASRPAPDDPVARHKTRQPSPPASPPPCRPATALLSPSRHGHLCRNGASRSCRWHGRRRR